MSNSITIGYSSCPNDTFIFDAMVHQKVDTEGLSFEVTMADVEELNQMAFNEKLEVTKLSFHALGHLLPKYILLNAGSALGRNCGPLLLSKEHRLDLTDVNLKIAIPGEYTTANFLLSLAYPLLQNKVELLFSDIEEAVLSGDVDAGLVIHESRFTYQERGLFKLADLGEFWGNYCNAPIPLGGIVVKRNIDSSLQEKIDRVLKRSVQYAFDNPESSEDYVKEHAQEMKLEVIKKHINLYVNSFSLNLGEEGRKAIELLYSKAVEKSIIKEYNGKLFVYNGY